MTYSMNKNRCNKLNNNESEREKSIEKLILGKPQLKLVKPNNRIQSNGNVSKTVTGSRVFIEECCICNDGIFDNNKIWFCDQCNVSIHLDCVNDWLGKSTKNSIWNCPICRYEVIQIPEFRCYCGKMVNPEIKPYSIEPTFCYSCGSSCGRIRHTQKLCIHPCTDLCHPGKCEPCNATVTRTCFCGKAKDQVKCANLDKFSSYPLNFSCKKICGKIKNCGIHVCELECHVGPCDICNINIGLSKCFCHDNICDLKCGETTSSFSCDEKCNKLLKCGNHRCQQKCHDDICARCPTNIDIIKNCPCGKVPILELVPKERTSCLDPIPTCDNECRKAYTNNENNGCCLHQCISRCHTGPCPPCQRPIEISCRCGSKIFKTTCNQSNKYKFTCKKRCKVMKQCYRHKCDVLCCDTPPPNHLCLLTCGALLPCGKHTCIKPCHPKGMCGKCNHYENRILECICGKIKIFPPILCGTKLPRCDQLCSKQQPLCGHQKTHMCHFRDDDCPPCDYPVDKYCNCGKIKQRNVQCSENNITCNYICGKLLPCSSPEYPHNCMRSCHNGECDKISSNESNLKYMINVNYKIVAEEMMIKCMQLCTRKKLCGHPCNMPCHYLSECPPIACKQEIFVTCSCGERVEKQICNGLPTTLISQEFNDNNTNGDFEKLTSISTHLECDENCRVIQRNKKLAEALDLDVISHYKGFYPNRSVGIDHPDYSEFLLNCLARYKIYIVSIEELFSKAVSLMNHKTIHECEHKLKLSPDLFPSNSSNLWKRIIHEYSEYFGCYYHFNNGYIKITTIKNISKTPSKLLSNIGLYNGESI